MTKRLATLWKKYHWGTDPDKAIKTRSKFHSDGMVEYGRCCEIQVAPTDKLAKQKAEYIFQIPETHLETSYLFFDSTKKKKPLMIELNPQTQKKFANLYRDIDQKPIPLKELANLAGGYQAKRRYPNVKAKPIGFVVAIVYRTNKKVDGLTNYIHHFGEPYKKGEKWSEKPLLCVLSDGELFLCGGNYKSEIEGIIN